MSEGISSDAGAAPSNGTTSATQSPAPGAASAPVTPKNGEGAVSKAPAPGEAKSSWQPLKTKLKFGDGQEEEVELADEETLQRRLIAAKGFDRANKEAIALKREKEELQKALASGNKRKALSLLGLDAREIAIEIAQEEMRREQMTEEQRQLEDRDARLKAAEAKAAKAEAALNQRLQAEAEEREWKTSIEPAIAAAVKAQGVVYDEVFAEELSRAAVDLMKGGNNNPAHWVAEAKERLENGFSKRLESLEPSTFLTRAASVISKASPEHLLAAIPEETLKAIIRLQSDKLRQARGLSTSATQPPREESKPVTHMTEYEYRKKHGL